MVTQVSTTDHGSPWSPPVWIPVFSTRLLAVAAATFGLVSCWLLARRLALTLQPLEPLVLVLVGLLVSAAILAGREVVSRMRPLFARRQLTVWWLVTSLGLACFGWALSITGTHPAALFVFWAVLVSQEFAAWRRLWAIRRFTSQRSTTLPAVAPAVDVTQRELLPGAEGTAASDPPVSDKRSGLEVTHAPWAETLDRAADDLSDDLSDGSIDHTADDTADDGILLEPGVSQQVTRSRTDQGGEIVTGLLRAELSAGERNCSLHVAFCPALSQEPCVEVIPLAGAAARVKAADVQVFGVRFDVRLTESSRQRQEVIMHFTARPPDRSPSSPADSATAAGRRNGME